MQLSGLVSLFLGYIMYICYFVTKNYGWAIILFTLITKIILLPVSIWVQKNGIKIVKIMPEINQIKINFFGDKDSISEKTAELYKREKYNPFASLIPTVVQLILLIGLVHVIYNPLTYILHLDNSISDAFVNRTCEITALNPESSSAQMSVVDAVKNPIYEGEYSVLLERFPDENIEEILCDIQDLNMSLFHVSYAAIPVQTFGITLLFPIMAALAAWLLCWGQNKLNPLQAESGTINKVGTTLFSVGLSLFLGAFVPVGVGIYWIFSNLFSLLQQFILNIFINPKDYIDYEKLNKTRKELFELENIGGNASNNITGKQLVKREKEDYKRFFSVANKHVVFYSEKSGFYKYFADVIGYLLKHSNLTVHYVTSDPDDQIFEIAQEEKRIRPYYIGEKKLITLMMKMDADIVIMTMPDIDQFHIKRSYVKQDIEYIYMFHWCTSTHMVIREKALDHYDTIFCPGPYQVEEIRFTEKKYGLPSKNLIETSYGVIENLVEAYEKMEKKTNETPQILIAPSYQAGNIMDSCIDGLLEQLLNMNYKIIVRPHPQYIRRTPQKIETFAKKYQAELEKGLFEFQTDFSSGDTVYQSDIVVTDWSTISYEFSFTTMKPTLFIDTPMKVVNPHYTEYPMEPLDISLRNKIGRSVGLDEIEKVGGIVEDMLENNQGYQEQIQHIREDIMPKFGNSAEIGGKYILSQLIKKNKK